MKQNPFDKLNDKQKEAIEGTEKEMKLEIERRKKAFDAIFKMLDEAGDVICVGDLLSVVCGQLLRIGKGEEVYTTEIGIKNEIFEVLIKRKGTNNDNA